LATTIAPSASAMATLSVSMWAASDSKASEPATNAVIASTITNVTVRASAIQSRPTFRAAVRRSASPWSWLCPPWP
jgi:hypothetical protein